MLDNLLVAAHVLDARAVQHGVRKLLYLASSCSYPAAARRSRWRSNRCMTGPLEPTNDAYATAKLAGWQLCQAYRRQYGAPSSRRSRPTPSARTTTSPENSGHVIPALIRRAARGEGCAARRPDASGAPASAARIRLTPATWPTPACSSCERYDGQSRSTSAAAENWSIAEAARADRRGRRLSRASFASTRPGPTARRCKMLDCRAAAGARAGGRPTDFRTALAETYDWFLQHEDPKETSHRCTQRLYRSLYRIRRVEEEIARVYPTDKIKSPVHLSIGQEAVSVGVCEALRSARRGLRHLPRPCPLPGQGRRPAARWSPSCTARPTGCTGGKGGSMHLIDPERGVMGTSAVVGTTIANAVGYAYALQLPPRATPSSSASSATARPKRASSPRA